MSAAPAEPQGAVLVRLLAARDRFATGLGAELEADDPQRIRLRLRVTEAHRNFFGYCHGGVIFSLADSAFGLACNVRGQIAVALSIHMTYAVAVRPGDALVATAREVTRTRRTGTYAVEVHNGTGTLVSSFTGTAYVTDKPVLPLPEP